MTLKAVIFAGGGTGGHIFPAIAICEHLLEADPGLSVRFICSDRSIDARILEPRGLDFRPIHALPFSLGPGGLVRFLRGWRGSVVSAERAVVQLVEAAGVQASEAVLVGTGGFVTVPAFAAARRLGLRTALVNLDAVPGKANRFLASRASVVFSTYDALDAERVGPIVRREARATADSRACRKAFDLEPDRCTLLVTGASQGAESLNRFVPSLVRHNPCAFEDWQILHQAGPDRAGEVRAEYESLSVNVRVVELVEQVGLMWGAADLAIARAGAGTVAEAWINRIPAVFLPYPYHRDEHQRHNARPLQEVGAALVLKDHIHAAANTEAHFGILEPLLTGSRELLDMCEAYDGLPQSDGGKAIAEKLRNL